MSVPDINNLGLVGLLIIHHIMALMVLGNSRKILPHIISICSSYALNIFNIAVNNILAT